MSFSSSRPTPHAAANEADAAAAATVLVVDDDADVRRSVSRLMRSAGYQVRTFASPADFLLQPLPAGPACLLLDMYMDEMTGLQVQAALRARSRQLPVVFVSGRSTISNAAAGFKAGAEDFLEKPVKPKELLEAVGRALAHDATRRADRADLDDMRRRHDDLTPREQEVMALVVAGLLNKQVAGDLGISEKTVKVHRARVMEKMEVESLAALVLIAQRLGVTPDSAGGAHGTEAGDPACLATAIG
jgi:FixJ family two-component response regulator